MATGEITAVVKSVPTTTVAFQVGPMEYQAVAWKCYLGSGRFIMAKLWGFRAGSKRSIIVPFATYFRLLID